MPGKIGFKSAEVVESEGSDEDEIEGRYKRSRHSKQTTSTNAKLAKRVRLTSEEPAARNSNKKASRKSVPATTTAPTASSESSSEVSSSSDSDESESEDNSSAPHPTNGTRFAHYNFYSGSQDTNVSQSNAALTHA